MRRFYRLFLVLLCLLSMMLLGCGAKEPVQTRAPVTAQELVIGIGRDFYEGPESTCFVHGSTGVWESLTYLNEKLEPVAMLAEELKPDETMKVWTVTLRRDVKFHDGTPLTGEAVVKNVMRLKERAHLDEYGTFLNLEKVEARDDYTVKFTFSRPEPFFPARIAYHGCPIFSPQSIDSEGRVTTPCGTGPFKFVKYEKDEALILARNEDYWGSKPKLTKVTYRIIPDPSTRLAALKNGEIHAVADVGGILPEQAAAVEGDRQLVLLTQPVTTSHYLLFNNEKPPFNDVRLRRMVSLFLDRAQLVREVLGGFGEPADTLFTPLAKEWVLRGVWVTDREKSRELAAQVKQMPQKATLVINAALANRWPYKPIAEILQYELKTLGLEVEIRVLEAGAWNESLKEGDYNMTLTPYTLMTGDPDFFCGRWVLSRGQMNVQRGVGYRNPEADRIVEEAATESNPAKRKSYYHELQRLLVQDVPFCPIYNDVTLYATRKEVRGLKLDPLFKPSLEKAWLIE